MVVVVTATPPDPATGQTATMIRVVDGDTIEVDINGAVERLRYIRIDTPETDERCAQAATADEKAGVGCLWDAASLAAEAAARAAATATPEPTERIMVTNLHANAAGRDQENLNEEYVTIVNLGPDLEIGGWSPVDEADHRYTFADFTWATGVELRLHTGSGTDGDGVFYWGASSPIWNNTGDTLWLQDATGAQVLVYSYTD